MFPKGWIYVSQFGIRHMSMAHEALPASVGLAQDMLEAGTSLAEYIGKQVKLIQQHLPTARFAGPVATGFAGADEAQIFVVRHTVENAGTMMHAQTYARLGLWLGIVTLTVTEAQMAAVRPDYEAFLKGLHIQPERAAEPGGESTTAGATPGGR